MTETAIFAGPERRRRWGGGRSAADCGGDLRSWRQHLRGSPAARHFAKPDLRLAPRVSRHTEPDILSGCGPGCRSADRAGGRSCAGSRIAGWAAENCSVGPASVGSRGSEGCAMIPPGARVWIAAGHTDMRRGMQGLALMVQQNLERNPHGGDLYVFRGRKGSLVKVLWHDGVGMSLYKNGSSEDISSGPRPRTGLFR
jgi:transposase